MYRFKGVVLHAVQNKLLGLGLTDAVFSRQVGILIVNSSLTVAELEQCLS